MDGRRPRRRHHPVITFSRSRIDAKRHQVPTAPQMAPAFKAFRAR